MKGVMKVKEDHYASRVPGLKNIFFIKTTEFCFKSIEFFRNCKLIGAGRLHSAEKSFIMPPSFEGGLAQLGERLHGMQEVSGSIPLSSTKNSGSPSSRGPGHDPFTVGTAVRIRLGTPIEKVSRWADFFCPKISRVRKRTRRGTACDGCGRCEFQRRN